MVYFIITLFVILMLYAIYTDLTTYTLPNEISIALIGLFAMTAFVAQIPLSLVGWHLAIGLAVFIVTFSLYLTIHLGAGDVKMLSALALWLGPTDILPYLLVMSLIGGVLACALLVFRRLSIPKNWHNNQTIAQLHCSKKGFPYGVAIAGAGLYIVQNTALYGFLTSS